jgi:dolichyl-phosphate-mannose--protein O-mannosyl transferase
MKSFFAPTADSPVLQWLGLIGILLFFFVVAAGVIAWRQSAKTSGRKRKRKHRHHRPTNPTLAQLGGLPPKRDPNQPPPGP